MQDTEKRSALERFLWENKITHATLAEESGVSRTTIWQLIKGNVTEEPKKAVTDALARYADAHEVPFDAEEIWT